LIDKIIQRHKQQQQNPYSEFLHREYLPIKNPLCKKKIDNIKGVDQKPAFRISPRGVPSN